jgi:phosphoglycerate kinase
MGLFLPIGRACRLYGEVTMKNIQDIDVKNKKVLVRVDFNVPLKGGEVTSDERIVASVPTIKYLVEKGAVVALVSHLGRPDGKKDSKYSLQVVVPLLSDLLGKDVTFIPDCVGEKRDEVIVAAKPGDIFMLENVRFYPEEEAGDPDFAEKLAHGFDLYVNDAFSASHRAHASITEVAKIIPAAAGLSLQNEISHLSFLTENTPKPFLAISGGAKISDKIDILKALIKKVDVLIIGGAMANTFLAAEGYEVGKSLYEEDYLSSAEEIVRMCEDSGVELMLPDDVVVAKSVSESAAIKVKSLDEIEKSDIIVDIGPRSIAKYSEPIKFASTIFWNGPVGINEIPKFAKGTIAIAKIIATTKSHSIIGGGDTVSAVKDLNLKFEFVSTGGGAALEYVAGESLPGLFVLE